MEIRNRQALTDAKTKHGDAAKAIDRWVAYTESATWRHLMDARGTFPHADAVETETEPTVTVTVFNIKGNAYRLIAFVDYAEQLVTVIALLTHAEYDKGKWKR